MKYCVLVNLIATDARNAANALFTSLQGIALGRRYPDTPATEPADYFVLAYNGVPVMDPETNEEIQLGFLLGYNQNCPQNLLTLVANVQQYCTGTISPNPPQTRAELYGTLRMYATRVRGTQFYWEVQPGDNMTVTSAADLLSKFTATPRVVPAG